MSDKPSSVHASQICTPATNCCHMLNDHWRITAWQPLYFECHGGSCPQLRGSVGQMTTVNRLLVKSTVDLDPIRTRERDFKMGPLRDMPIINLHPPPNPRLQERKEVKLSLIADTALIFRESFPCPPWLESRGDGCRGKANKQDIS